MAGDTPSKTIEISTGWPRAIGDSRAGCLVRIYPPGGGSSVTALTTAPLMIGRDADCALILADSAVSRHHASIDFTGRDYSIHDLGSQNGTWVNDRRVDRCVLASGDLIRVGKMILKFLHSDDIERHYHETIYAMMISDGLTLAANKRFFLEALQREVLRAQRHTRPLCLVMFDVDLFKTINDTHGHLAGDGVLRELCARVAASVRRDELLARYGGEEFAVLLPESTLAQAAVFGERIRSQVAGAPFTIDRLSIPVTISVGAAALATDSDMSGDALIALADAKLYEAKHAGRNRVAS